MERLVFKDSPLMPLRYNPHGDDVEIGEQFSDEASGLSDPGWHLIPSKHVETANSSILNERHLEY